MQMLSKIARRLRPAPTETLDGYDNAELIEVVFLKTKGYAPTEPWPAMQNAKTVLDFGGGCGLHYKQARNPTARWAVVETPAMVARAAELATDNLRFFSSIADAAAWLGDIDVMHSNGALQYTPDPVAVLKQLCALRARAMLWNRLLLSDRAETDVQTSRLIDNGPGTIRGVTDKAVTYTRTSIPESLFLACHDGYRLAERSADAFRFVR